MKNHRLIYNSWLIVKFTIMIGWLIINNYSLARAEKYNLFNPVPRDKLRPMNTERSSKSDFVTTVDAGHIQLETNLFSGINNKDCDSNNCRKTKSTSWLNENNIRIGITENSDLQIVNYLYTRKEISNSNPSSSRINNGFGDTYLRYKYSFSGNRSQKFGIALTPFIKLPTNQDNLGNKNFEGGMSAPWSLAINSSYAIGGMSQIFILKRNSNFTSANNLYPAFANAFYITKNFTNKLYGFAEYYTYKANGTNNWWQNTADFGIHYFINGDLKIDGGFNLGLTNQADDLNYYGGIAYRF